MNAWPFVVAAYGVAITLTIGLLVSAFLSMRRAEAALESLVRK